MKLKPTHGAALLLRQTTLAAAALCLSGCAALQIDVDVYKGPLVHDEDTQIQQLASIAMSGKAVMLLQRNKWLDTVSKSWRTAAATLAKADPAKSLLTRFIRSDEWSALGVCTLAEKECRHARLINDMLSAYEDKAEPALAHALDRTSVYYSAYRAAQEAYDLAGAKAAEQSALLQQAREQKDATKETAATTALKAATAAEAAALQQTTEQLRQTWGALVDLLIETKRLTQASQETGLKTVERQTAEILAKLTDPARLVCANQVLPVNGEVFRSLGLMSLSIDQGKSLGSDEAVNAADLRAIRHFNSGLRLAGPDELIDLKRAMGAQTSTEGCTPGAELAAASGSPTRNKISPRVQSKLPGLTRLGVQREATDSVVQEIDELLRDLQQTNASGFDRGRAQLGLDRLADDAANNRYKRRLSEPTTGDTPGLADSPQTKQLQDSVVDLASRMQFLAVNLELVDPTAVTSNTATSTTTAAFEYQAQGLPHESVPKGGNAAINDARAFKATLEAIANSLLVLAEDQRRQRFHRAHQRDFADNEYQSAVLAFQIDPARRFEHLVEHYKTRKTAALTTEAKRKFDLGAALAKAKAAKAAADQRTIERAAAHQAPLALAITLAGKLPDGATAPVPAEDIKNWATDAEKLAAVLAAAPAKLSLPALHKLIADWLVSESRLTSLKDGPQHRRLQAASVVLKDMEIADTTALARTEALQRLNRDLAQRLSASATAWVDAQKEALTATGKLEAAQAELDKFAPLRSGRLQQALDIVLATRATVLAQAAATKGAHDVEVISGLVKTQLQALGSDKADAKTEALAELEQWAAGAPPPIKLPDGKRASALETLDRIEAFLSYTRVDALNRGSTNGAEQATAALDALMARRERMSYLRPASMYLRSALATTGQQTDPSLEWSNLLWATVKRLFDENDISKKNERTVRAELDKSFWQNVNKVRVSAGGSSNFAIAKDDVGNWYVKAMGGDLEPMIKAAKNLALFNLGGRVDANFLRMDELRRNTARTAGEESELTALQDRRNGAAASAYGSTLEVFAANHATTVNGLLETVDARLKANTLPTELLKRWDTTYSDSASKRAALPDLDTTGGELAPLHTQALAAVGDGLAKTAETTPSGQLIKALGLLAQQRSRIKDKVSGLAELIGGELKVEQEQRAAVAAAAKVLADAQAGRMEPAKELAALQSQYNTATDVKKTELRGTLENKQKEVNEIGERIAAAHTTLVAAQVAAGQANTALAAARSKQARALEDVDAVWQQFIKDVAARHLRAVEEMETAARVVSQGVQGKPSKQQ